MWDRLSDLYGDQADTSYEVLQLWAQVEYAKLHSPDNGASIWCEILSEYLKSRPVDNVLILSQAGEILVDSDRCMCLNHFLFIDYPGSSVKSHLWLAYAQMESEYNSGRKMTTVLRQALSALSMTPDVHVIAELYRRNERCFGSYQTISDCQAYCEAYMQVHNKVETYRQPSTWRGQADRKQMGNQKPVKRPSAPLPRKQVPAAKKVMPPGPPSKEPKEPNFKYSRELHKCQNTRTNLSINTQLQRIWKSIRYL